jgi:hypothetical protein
VGHVYLGARVTAGIHEELNDVFVLVFMLDLPATLV